MFKEPHWWPSRLSTYLQVKSGDLRDSATHILLSVRLLPCQPNYVWKSALNLFYNTDLGNYLS